MTCNRCERKAYSTGLCQKHYMQNYRFKTAKKKLISEYWDGELLTAMVRLSNNKQDVTEFIVEHYKQYLETPKPERTWTPPGTAINKDDFWDFVRAELQLKGN